MLKKTIKYEDYNGNERKEDFWFHFTKAELTEMQLSSEGGLEVYIQRIIDTQDGPAIIKIFKDLVLKAYGEKSLDGKRFMKTDDEGRPLSRNFAQTEAYSILFMELATDAEKAAEFVKGIIPNDMRDEVEKQSRGKLPLNK